MSGIPEAAAIGRQIMPATATLEHPMDTFWGPETEPSFGISRDVEPQFKRRILRAETLRAHIKELSKIIAVEPHDVPMLPYYLISAAGTLDVTRGHQAFDIQALKTYPPIAKDALLLWLLDRDAWGDKSQQLKAEVKELLSLTRGWDGDNAEPIDPVSADRACAFVDSLGVLSWEFESFADPNGRVGLEAHRDNDAAYLLFDRDGSIAYVFRKQGAIHRGNNASPDAVKEVMSALF